MVRRGELAAAESPVAALYAAIRRTISHAQGITEGGWAPA
jgi:hypothetical protein